MTQHTVLIPAELVEQVWIWHLASPVSDKPLSAAYDAIVHMGLAKPESVKWSLKRAHLAYNYKIGPPTTVCMPQGTWDAVMQHAWTYGLPNKAEALRELLRLGLDLPEPKVSKASHGRRVKSPESDRTLALIRALHAGLASQSLIARECKVSRQYVHRVLKNMGGVTA